MDIFAKLKTLVEQACSADLITVIAAPGQQASAVGQMLAVPAGQAPAGLLVDAAFTAGVIQYMQTLIWTAPCLIEFEHEGRYQLFWDKLSGSRCALVLGAGHISQPVVELLAMLDYKVTVVDDRPEFANFARFPQAEVICRSFDRIITELALESYAAIIIVTRGHRYDLDCLRAALPRAAGYIGMIGSRRRVRLVLDMLAEDGLAEELLSRLKSPIGLDIGAQSPAEIAVSIAAEIIAAERGGSCRPLSSKQEW